MIIPFNSIFNFILLTCRKYNIDESHGLLHSMDVLDKTNNIINYDPTLNKKKAFLDKEIIYTSALLHDMCDKKYMNETEGITNINNMLKEHISQKEIQAVHDIVGTMSYSKVKKKGFPDLGKYQAAYHVVREADLLCAYDFDRALIYHMYRKNSDFQQAYRESIELFKNRVFKHEKDNLFTYDYSKQQAMELKKHSLQRIRQWKRIMNSL